ncbi:MAG: hypothetical protein IPL26_13415 [Leptospiraceae bacterium]|nr:hypothetical protein [Leptospiraceae bacterium]
MRKTTEKQERKLRNGNPSGHGFQKGKSGNPTGRAKKYITTVTDKTGYRNSEIQDCIKSMLRMTIDEISEIQKSKDAPVLEKIIASGIQSDIGKGELKNLETLMNRSYGKPKESIELDASGNLGLTPELEAAAKILHERNMQQLTKDELYKEAEKMGLDVSNLFDK